MNLQKALSGRLVCIRRKFTLRKHTHTKGEGVQRAHIVSRADGGLPEQKKMNACLNRDEDFVSEFDLADRQEAAVSSEASRRRQQEESVWNSFRVTFNRSIDGVLEEVRYDGCIIVKGDRNAMMMIFP